MCYLNLDLKKYLLGLCYEQFTLMMRKCGRHIFKLVFDGQQVTFIVFIALLTIKIYANYSNLFQRRTPQ